jgi:hypothetical protein
MPRYFFTVGSEEPDDVGVELADDKAARSEAIRAAGEILREIDGALDAPEWFMRVTDEAGSYVLELRFSVRERSQ